MVDQQKITTAVQNFEGCLEFSSKIFTGSKMSKAWTGKDL